MKRIIFFLAAAIFVVSCDKIEKPYKIDREMPVGVDTPSFPPLTDVLQKYLFEDYTGHLCTNCPEGAEILKNLKTVMNDTLVLMAVHAGVENMVRPNPSDQGCSRGYTADYRTTAGNEYAATFNVNANPSGMINRINFAGSPVLKGSTNWVAAMNSVERKAPTMGLQIIPIVRNDTAYIFIKSTLLSAVSSKLRLCAVLVENGIVSPQKNGKAAIGSVPNICDYEHNHVLRSSITSTWGDNIELSNPNDTIIKAYGLLLAEKSWRKENCYVIAFIYDEDTKEILQVEEVRLVGE